MTHRQSAIGGSEWDRGGDHREVVDTSSSRFWPWLIGDNNWGGAVIKRCDWRVEGEPLGIQERAFKDWDERNNGRRIGPVDDILVRKDCVASRASQKAP